MWRGAAILPHAPLKFERRQTVLGGSIVRLSNLVIVVGIVMGVTVGGAALADDNPRGVYLSLGDSIAFGRLPHPGLARCPRTVFFR